jgi:hypothetical protein
MMRSLFTYVWARVLGIPENACTYVRTYVHVLDVRKCVRMPLWVDARLSTRLFNVLEF